MSPIMFQNPVSLLLLLLMVPLAILLKRARQRREMVLAQMGADDSLRRRRLPDRIRLVSVALLIVAFARPGYSPQRFSISKQGRDVVFVLDVSRSMLAEDAYPSRLEAAKDGIRDALDQFQSERAGLVVYAGSANILCPLTYDYDFVRYTLDQANTRTVDFGGTTLLSAVEKCIGSMLSDDRRGMQDLVVLTDGEDHDADNQRVTQLLGELDLGLLLIGLGDASSGSRIPIKDDDGKTVYVKYADRMVTTRLNDEGLRKLASLSSDAVYQPVGTAAFDLADMYAKYVVDKPISGTAGTDTYTVYREAGFALIALALVLLMIAERLTINARSAALAGLVILCTLTASTLHAADFPARHQFGAAMQLQQQGQYDEALEAYASLEAELPSDRLSLAGKASLEFNRGLCHLAQAKAIAEAEPRTAFSKARQAQLEFLTARRILPTFHRPALRLDSTARLIADYEARVAEEDSRNQKLQEKLQQLVDRLRELQQKQIALRNKVPERKTLPKLRQQERTNPVPPIREPETAADDSKQFAETQRLLKQEGAAIEDQMKALDQAMMPPEMELQDAPISLLQQPRRLMTEVISSLARAETMLTRWGTWPDARDQQHVAIQKIQEILDLLASDDSDERDGDDEEEDGDMMEPSDSDKSISASMEGQGDFASDAAMQPLPLPNYSVDDILQQEQGSLQFRQQQRAKSNQKSVEKDW